MAFITQDGQIVKPYRYARYPLVMHKGQHPDIQSIHVNSEQEEQAAATKGFSLERPPVPEPVPEKAAMTMEDRLSELEDRVAELEERLAGHDQPASAQPEFLPEEDEEDQPKRGRGRSRKEA